jgi:hypothetical protein
MATMHLVTNDAVATVTRHNGRWRAALGLQGRPTQCIAADPLRPEIVACGTFGQGPWLSRDAGATWEPAGAGIAHGEIMAVAFSAPERGGEGGVLWAGTEPSALFRSEDGGRTWRETAPLGDIPSAPTWRFPPRPWTHHVRWIAPDPHMAARLFVGIELGGVMRSLDGGRTWEDRKPGSQHDAHTLRTHRLAPGRVYEAAGGGYAESRDGGASWAGDDAGLSHRYLWGLAVDPGDPDTLVASVAPSAREAHNPRTAESRLYRKTGGGAWQEAPTGLPEPRGTRSMVLAANEAEPGVFYAAGRDGAVYRSPDAGGSWEQLDIAWPDGYRVNNVEGFVVVEAG